MNFSENELFIHPFDEFFNLISIGQVANFKRFPGDPRTVRQVLEDDGVLWKIEIDEFGRRGQRREISSKKLRSLYDDWVKPVEPDSYNWGPNLHHFTFHKKRTPARKVNPNILDEEACKIQLYTHLVNSYPNASIIPEFSLLSRRADFAVFDDGLIHLFEIKSEIDSIERLEVQIEEYQHYSTHITLVLHKNKMKFITQNKKLGILEISNQGIKHKRKPQESTFSTRRMCRQLWSKERAIGVKGVKGASKLKSLQSFSDFLCSSMQRAQQRRYLSLVLKQRFSHENSVRRELLKNEGVGAALNYKRKFDDPNQSVGLPILGFLSKLEKTTE